MKKIELFGPTLLINFSLKKLAYSVGVMTEAVKEPDSIQLA
jgi:hypothetical protein